MFFVVIIFMVHPADTPVLHTDVSDSLHAHNPSLCLPAQTDRSVIPEVWNSTLGH